MRIHAAFLVLSLTLATAPCPFAATIAEHRQAHLAVVELRLLPSPACEPSGDLPRLPGNGLISVSLAGDLALSDSISPARFKQGKATIAPTNTGFAAWWEDTRDGATSVYQQSLDGSGNLVGVNQLFRSLPNGDDLGEPKVVRDGLGKLHLFVRDQSHGLIYGARLASDLTIEVGSYLVNDSSGGASAGLYDVAVYPDGRLVVVWEDYSGSGNWIRERTYSAAGVPGSIVQVSSLASATQQWSPSVAVDPAGGFLIAWEDYRNSQADIYARQFDAGGATVGSDLSFVPGGPAAAEQIRPVVTYSSVHKFVVGWIDGRVGQQYYAQRFDPVSGLVGSNTLINAASPSALIDDPDLVTLPNGTVMCAWASFAASNQLLMTSLTAGFVPQTELPINAPITGQRWGGTLWPIDNSAIAAVWTAKDVDQDIRVQRLTTGGVASWIEKQLNDDLAGSTASDPAVAAFTTWNHLAVFADERNDGGDIFVQPFTTDGQRLGLNRRVTQDAPGVTQSLPAIAARPGGGIITWRDDRPVGGISGERIFGRMVDAGGGFPAGEFLISDSLAISGKSRQQVAMNGTGLSLVAWQEGAGLPQRIFARFIAANGSLSGAVQLLDSVSAGAMLALAVGSDSLGRFSVAWLQQNGSNTTMFVRRYGSNQLLQTTFSVSLPGGAATTEGTAAVQPDGGLVAAWTETQGTGRLLRVIGCNAAGGIRFGPTTVVSTAAYTPRALSLSSDEQGRIALTWLDNRTASPLARGTILGANLTTMVPDFAVAAGAPNFMRQPVVSARFGRAHLVWLDPRSGGLAPFASTTLFDATDADGGTEPVLPQSFGIRSIFPNPFNPSATISFTVPARTMVRVSVVNLLGQEVAVLLDARVSAGEHRVTWNAAADGSNIASGIYLAVLRVGDQIESRAMVLLK